MANTGGITPDTASIFRTLADAGLRELAQAAIGKLGRLVTTNTDDIDWARVAEAINHRMKVMRVSQRRLAGIADVSPMTLRDLSRGEHKAYQALPLTKLSAALGWGADGILRIGRGEDVAAIEAEVAANDNVDPIELLAEIRDQFGEILERLDRIEHGEGGEGTG